ncbi:succinoglycan biosynthesis protein exoa [Paracoccus contaminans]|uniref:Succinoglycan biosynthesis protein exoa n=2 Tax=Paracoccus contaminans TaxID=1945662 RepID=A0A1W6D0R9_9RHOB|nr:succinoglycan biosynthesis protein exoa [Paracoccus contaminans]
MGGAPALDLPDPAGPVAGRVLIVIPTLNEAAHIADVLDAVLPFADRADARIVVVDGGSADATAAIVRKHAARHPRIALLDNPGRLQAAAVNRAVEAWGEGHEWLLRLDAHSAYPPDYGDALLAEAAQTGADSVVVSMQAQGEGGLQRLIADAQNSRIGNGGSAHRLAGRGAWVDHGHHALMRMAAFRAVGGYDERFSHNEDAELDHRLRAAGYRIRLTGRTALGYFPRKRLAPLMRQYFNFGRGRARNLAKHGTRPALRQAAVAMLAPALLLTLLVPLSPVFALPLAVWLLACLAGGLMIARSTRNPAGVLAGFIAGLMHLAWSAGYWSERLAPAPRIGRTAT